MVDIQRAIDELIVAATNKAQGTSRTQAVAAHLEKIEEALAAGVGTKALAEQFGWTSRAFCSALYRARQMAAKGGDRRLKANRSASSPRPANPFQPRTPVQPQAGDRDSQLRSEL